MIRPAISFLSLVLLAACLNAPATAAPATAEDKLLEVLASQADAAKKSNACRELQTAGTEKSIPALAALLTGAETSHEARIALETMPYPAAGAALRDALGKTTGLIKSGIIDSIGERHDAAAVPLLTPALADTELQVASAAAIALGKIGTPQTAQILDAAMSKASGEPRAKIAAGLVLCADRLLKAGDRGTAVDIYQKLSQPGEMLIVRMMAVRGVVETAQDITTYLGSSDPLVRAAAAHALRDQPADKLRGIADRMATLPATSQAAILAAIRIRGDRSFAGIALEATKSKDEAVGIAAVRALGAVGDAGALPLLLGLATERGPKGDAARQSLNMIRGPEIDEGILAALESEKDAGRRVELIALVESRRAKGAVAALVKESLHPSPEVRSRAMTALANMASPKDVPTMIRGMLKAEKGPARDGAERAIVLVCQQIPDAAKRAYPVIETFRTAAPAEQAALLPLIGRVGGAAAKQAIQAALASQQPEVYEAGLRALCNWPDSSFADQMLNLAGTAGKPEYRLWALRGFVRVVSLPGQPDAQRLANLKKAMPLASRPEDRAFVLERASAVRTVETLRFVVPYMDDPSLAEQACRTVAALAHHKELRVPHKQEFEAALQKVLKISKDGKTIELAKRSLQGN